MNNALVSFGLIGCNRLHYLRACIDSILETTAGYQNKEFIIVDNASVEHGTDEYLQSLRSSGHTVVKNDRRDPSNEFARGLNTCVSLSRGDVIVLLQGDMQFIVREWLQNVVMLLTERDDVGCVILDAQRRSRNEASRSSLIPVDGREGSFAFDMSRNPVSCAGDAAYDRRVLQTIGEWSTSNANHEGGNDSETDMLKRVKELVVSRRLRWKCVMPIVPPAVAIFTDKRGTMARVRGLRRYGDYWPPKDGRFYYEIIDRATLALSRFDDIPMSIEQVANPIGFDKPLDPFGNWLKNPIRPELAVPSDYVDIEDNVGISRPKHGDDDKLDEWLNS